MAEHFHEVVWLIDRSENRPIYISPAYEAIAGRSRRGMYANLGDWFDAIHVDDRQRVRRAFEEHATDGAFDMTYRLVRPDGSIRWIHDRGYPIRDDSGHIHRIAGIAVDITERKHAEHRTRVLEDQLAHLARLDTMGQIASGLAHELNQPLAAICNYADTCLAMLDDESHDRDAIRQALTRVSQLALRTGDIIDRVRKMVRREQPQHVTVSVSELVDDIVSLTEARLRINGIELHIDLPDTPLVVVVDGVQIQQVLLNLIGNAIAAMGAKHHLKIAARESNSGCVTISVTDTGPGIEPDRLESIFEPFATTKPHGIGMGLAISRTIVEAHGGQLVASNCAAGGATFCFDVPINIRGNEHE